MSISIKEELDEMMDFTDCVITRVGQYDSDLHIAKYRIGDDYWLTFFEGYDRKRNYTRVNINEKGLNELYRVLKEIMEN